MLPIKTSPENCFVTFKNNSEIWAASVDQRQMGDNARGWRFQVVIVDEARLLRDSIIEEIIAPIIAIITTKIIDIRAKSIECFVLRLIPFIEDINS